MSAQASKSATEYPDSRIDIYGGYGYFHPINSGVGSKQYFDVTNPNATISVTGSTFTSNADTDFYVTTDSAASGTNSVTFSNNQVNGGGGAELNMGGTSKTTITMDGNNIQGVGGNNGIGIDDGAANANGATLTFNTVGVQGAGATGGAGDPPATG